jgi:hypothetical protein
LKLSVEGPACIAVARIVPTASSVASVNALVGLMSHLLSIGFVAIEGGSIAGRRGSQHPDGNGG